MPIQFRCTGCNQKLAISRRKAGKVVKCPACATEISVPSLEEAAATGQLIESPDAPPQQTPPVESPPPEESPTDELPPGALEDLFEEDEQTFDPPETDEYEFEAEPPYDAQHQQQDASVDGSAAESPAAALQTRRWDDDEEEEDDGFQLRGRALDESGLDMTPMVDVTFLLLIFFMITATFSLQKSMETEAPKPEDDGAAQLPTMDDFADDSVIVEIDENDVIFVDEVQVGSLSELTDVLEQKMAGEKKTEMIIEAHPQAKHGTVVQTTDAGIEVGMQRIRRVSRKGE